MSLQKWLWAAVAMGVLTGMAWADPMRTVFTRENQFPKAMGVEVALGGGMSSYDEDMSGDEIDSYDVTPGVRFGVTERLAVLAEVPYRMLSIGDEDEKGVGDMSLGVEFLFFEDIFEYAWIVPHATAILPTGDEDKMLGTGETQGRFGISAGTTVNDIFHFAADVSYTANGAISEDDMDERDDLLTGAVSLVVDLDERASVLGEAQLRDDPVDSEDDYAARFHLGLVYEINEHFTLMGYGGGTTGLYEDYYGMGRLVYQF